MLARVLRIGVVMAALAAGGAAAMVAAAPVEAAGPSAYEQVLRVYESDGTVPACQFSGTQLADALKGVDTYGAQYFADFTQAIQAALSARAAGACARSRAAGPAPVPGGVAEPPAHFGSVTAATSAGVPAPLAVMGVVALIGGLIVAGAALARARGRRSRAPHPPEEVTAPQPPEAVSAPQPPKA